MLSRFFSRCLDLFHQQRTTTNNSNIRDIGNIYWNQILRIIQGKRILFFFSKLRIFSYVHSSKLGLFEIFPYTHALLYIMNQTTKKRLVACCFFFWSFSWWWIFFLLLKHTPHTHMFSFIHPIHYLLIINNSNNNKKLYGMCVLAGHLVGHYHHYLDDGGGGRFKFHCICVCVCVGGR